MQQDLEEYFAQDCDRRHVDGVGNRGGCSILVKMAHPFGETAPCWIRGNSW